MQNKKPNVKLLWMQFEDVLAPRLGLTVWDRAVYSYLLRHSLVVGKLRLHFAVLSVARDLRLSNGPVRQAVRRLDELGALRLLERSKTGHLVEMRLPEAGPPSVSPSLRRSHDTCMSSVLVEPHHLLSQTWRMIWSLVTTLPASVTSRLSRSNSFDVRSSSAVPSQARRASASMRTPCTI